MPDGEPPCRAFVLPGRQNQLISSVAAANPETIVVLHTGSAVTMPWLNQVAGVLEGWYSVRPVIHDFLGSATWGSARSGPAARR
jgi:hypothetical protein